MKRPGLKKIKKSAQAAVAASVASAGILVGGLFTSPADLTQADGSTPTAVITLAEAAAPDGAEDAAPEPEERRRGLRARLRLWILRLPPWLRAMVGVPLWGVGWLLIAALSALWTGLLSPVAGGVLELLCFAALLAGLLCVCLKAAFPQMPVRDILNKRSALTLILGLGLVGIAGAALELLYPGAGSLPGLVRGLGALAVLAVCAAPAIIKLGKRAREGRSACGVEGR